MFFLSKFPFRDIDHGPRAEAETRLFFLRGGAQSARTEKHAVMSWILMAAVLFTVVMDIS